MTPEQEVRFWRYFHRESIRLFGDKRGTYRELHEKAMDRLYVNARLYAVYGPFDGEPEHLDDLPADWSKQRAPNNVVGYYTALLSSPNPPDRWAAIRQTADLFEFPSLQACYQFLKREGVKGLPDKRTAPPRGQL
jgi:hypothetical protein